MSFLNNISIEILIALITGVVFGIFSTLVCFLIMRHINNNKRQKVDLSKHDRTQTTKDISTHDWHLLTTEQTLEQLTSSQTTGLHSAEVIKRQKHYGSNQLEEKPPRPAWLLFVSQFQSFLIMVLVAAALLATAIGELKDGIVILIVVFINALLGFYQEFQAEKSLAALKKMLALKAKVRREGKVIELPADQLVPGDIVLLEAGDKIPADGRIISANTLEVDESSFTGESLPVTKQTLPLAQEDWPLAERNNMLYMNNAVTRGRAELVVTAIGMLTEIGRLAGLLAQSDASETPLQLQLDSLGKRLALIAVLVIAVLFTSALWRGEPLIQTAFTAIALAVAAIPEGLPAVVTVTLALGMHRMARQRAIVKKLAAVETLGCTTVICTDKTGTLTVNQMTVRSLFYKNQSFQVSGEGYQVKGVISPVKTGCPPADLTELLQPITLCNDSQLQDNQIVGDPMEGALLVLAAKAGIEKKQVVRQMPRIAEIPFDAEHKFMATFHRNGDQVKLCVKGAPEVLFSLCSTMLDEQGELTSVQHDLLQQENATMAGVGLRILGVATRIFPAVQFKAENDLFHYVQDLSFVGLVGLMDPPRAEAHEAIKLCQQAGIAVKMITGDQKITATAIAQELGLIGEILEGKELSAMHPTTLAKRIDTISVFSRSAPEQKVQIVKALKTEGHIVAMTGDGVNDAPALKTADIGVSMGITGTDVAKEAATMILTDDNFATIVKAIKEGRAIYDNMIKFVRFQLSTNIGAILTVASAPLLGLPVPFSAIQLLWINIIMDGPPAMALGIDPAKANCMSEKPRDPKARILSLKRLGNLFSYGLTMAGGTLAVLYYDLQTADPEHAMTLAFNTFVLFQVFNIFNARTENGTSFNTQFFSNKALWFSLTSVVLLQILVVQWLPAQLIFHTSTLTLLDWTLATAVAASVLILEELRMLVRFILNWLTKLL
jgi:P-type Ca2+ transporter type 2C